MFQNFKIGGASKIYGKIIPQFWCGGYKGSVTKNRESPEVRI